MASILLYSVNVALKHLIQTEFRGGSHYVWCSEYFDSRKQALYTRASMVPPSSSPAEIYERLKRDVQGKDHHSSKIAEQKTSLKSLAVRWHAAAEINDDQRDEIVYMVDHASFDDWRPLLFVIPLAQVASRVATVPPSQRAGTGPEFILTDLAASEFHVLEF